MTNAADRFIYRFVRRYLPSVRVCHVSFMLQKGTDRDQNLPFLQHKASFGVSSHFAVKMHFAKRKITAKNAI